MNRGSTVRPCLILPEASGFNEAPIHESGKYGPAPSLGADRRASMRPRFMNRGSLGRRGVLLGKLGLQ